MKKIIIFATIISILTLFTSCSSSIDSSSDKNVERADLTITADSSSRAILTSRINKAVITVTGDDFSEVFTTSASAENGSNSESVTISGIPVGKNRIITVKAYYNETKLKNLVMRAVTDINSGSNSINVTWETTALGNVYNALMEAGESISEYDENDAEIISQATDQTAKNARLVDEDTIASDFIKLKNGKINSMDQASNYLLTPGSLSFTFYYPLEKYDDDESSLISADTFSAWLLDPLSEEASECELGNEITIGNCTPGTYLFYITDSSGNLIFKSMTVKINEGENTQLGILSYNGIMVIINAENYSSYNTLYSWECSIESYESSSYPGDTMNQYGSYYIKAFPACQNISVIANNGTSSESGKLCSSDNTFNEYGIYELTSNGFNTLVTSDSSESDSDEESIENISFENLLYINLSTPSWATEESGTYTKITTSKATIGDDSNYIKIQLKKNNGVSTGLIQVNAANTTGATEIHLTGTMTEGGVKIQTNGSDAVSVYLDSANITSSNYPCLEITKGSSAYIVTNGSNTFIDGRTYGTGYGEEYSTSSSDTYEDDDGNTVSCTVVKSATYGSDAKGSLYSKGNLILSGSGTLTITESYKNCIASKGFITVNDGNYSLTSNAKNGFSALYGFTQNGGTINFTGNGGILLYGLTSSGMGSSSSSFTTTSTKTNAYVHKSSGIVVDGIISDTSNGWIKINGGTYTCTAEYGKGMNAKWDSSEDTDSDGGSENPDPSIYINGGTITITVSGNEYNGDNNVYGTYYDADGVLCSSQNVVCAAEGIESQTGIYVNGGSIIINAEDDGFNASSSDGEVIITDGSIYVYATSGDGIDCNGKTLTITGGTIVTMAPTGSENALDCDGTFTISGGYLAALAGSSTVEGTWSVSQPVIHMKSSSSSSGMGAFSNQSSSSSTSGVWYASAKPSAGSTIVIKDSSSNVLYAFTIPSGIGSNISLLTITSPNFSSSSCSNYTLYTGCSISGGEAFYNLYTSMPTCSTTGSSYSLSSSSKR